MWRQMTSLMLCLGFVLGGCVTHVGPKTVPPSRLNYNQAVAHSWNEQLLLNLVRMRYRDTTFFLEVSSVLNQYSVSQSATPTLVLGLHTSASDAFDPSATYSISENPTITYTPLQGEDFVRRLLSSIPPDNLTLLAGSGWSIERLLECCVDRLNEIDNAVSAAGPTPDVAPRYESFQEAAKLMRKLQKSGTLEIINDTEKGEALIRLGHGKSKGEKADDTDVAKLRQLLDLEEGKDSYVVTWEESKRKSDQISLRGRSLLGAFYFVSQGVEPPEEHQQEGLVTMTRDADGQPFDWSKITGNLMRIRSQKERPDGAFVRIRYRDHWFYIDDSDLNSKTTFALLTYLFSLQASSASAQTPTVTVSAGS